MVAFRLPPSRKIGEVKRALEAAVEAGEIPRGQATEAYLEILRANPGKFLL
jgi:poly(A) polymerase